MSDSDRFRSIQFDSDRFSLIQFDSVSSCFRFFAIIEGAQRERPEHVDAA